MEHILLVILTDVVKQNFAGLGYATTDYKSLGITDSANDCKAFAEVLTEFFGYFYRKFVSCFDSIENRLG